MRDNGVDFLDAYDEASDFFADLTQADFDELSPTAVAKEFAQAASACIGDDQFSRRMKARADVVCPEVEATCSTT